MNPIFLLYRDLFVKVKLHIQGRAMAQEITSWTLNPEPRVRFHIGLHGFRSEQSESGMAFTPSILVLSYPIKSTMLRTHSFKYHRHNVFINLQPR
jgi:hypothetical protein